MSSSVSFEYMSSFWGDGTTGITPEGGFYETFLNATGALSVKGTIVAASTTLDNAVMIAPANSVMPMGVVYQSGVLIGQPMKVVTYGKAKVLLKNDQPSTRGYWAGVSDVPGRMNQLPTPNESTHSREIGHSLESKAEGTDVLALVQLHFN